MQTIPDIKTFISHVDHQRIRERLDRWWGWTNIALIAVAAVAAAHGAVILYSC
jgi:hypothetical protein